MTLSIAAKYPWGALRKLSVFEKNLPSAIIFATDSRWTKYYPNSQKYYEDVGTKFFDLTLDSGIVYAGDVQSGEQCVNELKEKFQTKRKRSYKESMYTAEQIFQRVYKHHVGNRKTKVFPLFMLVGVCDKNGDASLIYFSSPKFNPIFIEGIYGIGVREAYKDFEIKLNNEIEKAVKGEFDLRSKYPILESIKSPVQNNAEHIGIVISAILKNQIVDNDKYLEIGGAVQYAIISKDGVIMPGLSSTKDPTGATDTWHKITPVPDEITTYHEKYKLGPDFININSFSVFKISN